MKNNLLHNRLSIFNIFMYLLFLLVFFTSCSTANIKRESVKLYTFISYSYDLPKSKELIDKTPTYEVYFDLLEETRCIDISVVAQDRNGKRVRCAFILESLVDISRFPKKPFQPVYSEIAKNFDSNWRFQSNIFVCTDDTDPLKRLTKGNYRLKISAFSTNYYTFTIDIKSSVPVEFKK
ncbi:MAG: hypothetical protein QHH74_05615 [Spirochaetota bacterium]|nr:hypothetical protein [Spirochaetota bacterium]